MTIDLDKLTLYQLDSLRCAIDKTMSSYRSSWRDGDGERHTIEDTFRDSMTALKVIAREQAED